jgi:hypothetical protein
VDGTFSFLQDVSANGYYAATRTPGRRTMTGATSAASATTATCWARILTHLRVGESFNPEVGFLRRRGFRETSVSGALQPAAAVDRLGSAGSASRWRGLPRARRRATYLESREKQAGFQLELESSDLFDLSSPTASSGSTRPFRIQRRRGVAVPAGSTRSATWKR